VTVEPALSEAEGSLLRLRTGVVSSGCYVRFDHTASTLVLLNPALSSRRWQVVLADASSIPSFVIDPSHLLNEVTAFGSRLIAFPPLLLTIDNQSHATGWCSLPSTKEVGVDGYALSLYHLTNIDIQLSKNIRSCSLLLIPWLSPVSSEQIAPNRCKRIGKPGF
jgi:hypothetical protein